MKYWEEIQEKVKNYLPLPCIKIECVLCSTLELQVISQRIKFSSQIRISFKFPEIDDLFYLQIVLLTLHPQQERFSVAQLWDCTFKSPVLPKCLMENTYNHILIWLQHSETYTKSSKSAETKIKHNRTYFPLLILILHSEKKKCESSLLHLPFWTCLNC